MSAPDLPDHAVVDLLGLVALGELLAFERMAVDARLAPDLRRRAALGEMAAAEIGNYRRLADRLATLGVLPDDAMAPYVGALQAYHDSTEPRDWAEAVTKAYVGDAITDDFIREIAAARSSRGTPAAARRTAPSRRRGARRALSLIHI